jgi:hypothetical protein
MRLQRSGHEDVWMMKHLFQGLAALMKTIMIRSSYVLGVFERGLIVMGSSCQYLRVYLANPMAISAWNQSESKSLKNVVRLTVVY